MLFVSEDGTPGCFASVPEGRPGPVGMYTVPAHVDPRRVRHGGETDENEVKRLQRKEKKDERKS
jgi:hypothetical protein